MRGLAESDVEIEVRAPYIPFPSLLRSPPSCFCISIIPSFPISCVIHIFFLHTNRNPSFFHMAFIQLSIFFPLPRLKIPTMPIIHLSLHLHPSRTPLLQSHFNFKPYTPSGTHQHSLVQVDLSPIEIIHECQTCY